MTTSNHNDRGTSDDLASQPELGAALKRARLEQGLSLADVSAETGISTSFLSVVEKGRSEITIGRLIRLLAFYGIRINDLLPGAASSSDRIVLAPHERRPLISRGEGVELYLLAHDAKRSMMPVYGVHQPGSRVEGTAVHEGEVFVFVLEGSLLFEREGHDPFLVQEGYSAYYEGGPAVTISNPGSKPARLIGVVTPPTM